MKAKQPARSLRDQITTYLARHTEATAKTIAAHTTERDFPSRALNELNRMRTDALVECEKREGKGNEYYYWLVARPAPIATQTGEKPQPEVGENTGSDGSAVSVPDASTEAVAVHEPAPAPAAATAAPVAEDDSSALADQLAMYKEICVRYGVNDCPAGLAGHLSRQQESHDKLLERADVTEQQRDAWKTVAERFECYTPDGLAEHVAELHTEAAGLHEDRAELGAVHDLLAAELAPEWDPRDPSDMETESLARIVLEHLNAERRNAVALADKLQHLLDSKTHECEALRSANTVGAVATDTAAVDVIDAATGYLVRVPKRRPRIVTKPQSAREAALAAARNGAGRADVFALVHVGSARRGAEWKEPQ